MAMQPAVFLDLDKTIIGDTGGLSDFEEVTLIKGAAPAIASLRGLGYRIVVVANHEGVARGRMTEEDVEALHVRVAEMIRATANGAVIDAFYYCPFHPRGQVKGYKKDHPNRKPKPGMLTQAADEMGLELSASWMIGDELADVQAGHAAGARTILLRPDAEQLRPVDPAQMEGVTSEAPDRDRPTGPDFFAVGLIDAARLIAQQPRVEAVETKRAATGRKWDAEKIAKIQVPRPPAKPGEKDGGGPVAAKQMGRAFRPWGAPTPEEDDTPIVAKPYQKRQQAEAEAAAAKSEATRAAEPSPPKASPPPSPPATTAPPEIPENIREAIEKKKRAAAAGSPIDEGVEKTLRLILQELRAQRGMTQEFSFLTIIAVALQLVAIVCLLGGLFLGDTEGMFLKWLGSGLILQLTGIATLLYGR